MMSKDSTEDPLPGSSPLNHAVMNLAETTNSDIVIDTNNTDNTPTTERADPENELSEPFLPFSTRQAADHHAIPQRFEMGFYDEDLMQGAGSDAFGEGVQRLRQHKFSLGVLLLIAATLLVGSSHHDNGQRAGAYSSKSPHPHARFDEIRKCSARLSPGFFLPATAATLRPLDRSQARWKAVNYFWTGGGQNIEPECEDLNDPSLFTVVYSLIVLRESLHLLDDSWNHDENFHITSSKDFCQGWPHLRCARGRVVGLDLTNANLTGTIPPEVGHLRSLEDFKIDSNVNIRGPIPTYLGHLTNLKRLMVQQTSIAGSVPTILGRLSLLKDFQLWDTMITGSMPQEVCRLLDRDGALSVLRATCDIHSFQCDCCTEC